MTRDNHGTLEYVEGKGTCWTPDPPAPGDVVSIDRDYCGAKLGQRAVIDGSHFGMDFDNGKGPVALAICGSAFYGPSISRANPAANGPEYVSVSGGPCPFVPLAELEYVGRITHTFWRWRDMPRKDGGVNYEREVTLWSWPSTAD